MDNIIDRIEDGIVVGLKKPISIASKDGGYVEVRVLQVNLPSIQKYNVYADVVSIVSKSVLAMKDKVANKESVEALEKREREEQEKREKYEKLGKPIPNNNPLPLIIFAGGDNLTALSEVIDKYLITCCTFDDTPITKGIINKLSIGDYSNILSEISGFLFKQISQ